MFLQQNKLCTTPERHTSKRWTITAGRKTGGRNFTSENQPHPSKRTGGRIPNDLKKANALTKERLDGLLNKHLWLTKDQAIDLINDPTTPMIELLIASIVDKALIHGDDRRMSFILDRLIGKVKETIDINSYMSNLQKLTESQVIDLGKDAIKFLDGDDDKKAGR